MLTPFFNIFTIKLNKFSIRIARYCFLIFLSTGTLYAGGTFTSLADGAWEGGAAVWTIAGDADNLIDNDDAVVIKANHDIDINSAAVCASLQIGDASAAKAATLIIDPGNSLNITTAGGGTGNLSMNPTNNTKDYTLSVNTGALTVAGTYSWGTGSTSQIIVTTGSATFTNAAAPISASSADHFFSLTNTGSFTFASLITVAGGTIENTGTAGTFNFNGGLTFNSGNFPASILTGTVVNFGGGTLTAGAAMVFTACSDQNFTGATTITPTAGITFGDFIITGFTVTLNGNISVACGWTNNGGTLLSGAANIVTMKGAAFNIGGTSPTDFPILQIGNQPDNIVTVYTLVASASNSSCTGLVIDQAKAGSGFVQTGLNFNVNGSVTVRQSNSVSATPNAWTINTGTATVTGGLTIGNSQLVDNKDASVIITTGVLNVNGNFNTLGNTGSILSAFLDMGGGAGTFNLGGNWTNNNGDFIEGASSIVNFNGVVAQTITNTIGAGETFFNLQISNSSGMANSVTLANAVTVTNTLTFSTDDGILKLGTNNLIVGVPGSASGTISGESTLRFIATNSTGILQRFISAAATIEFPVAELEAGTFFYNNLIITPDVACTFQVRVQDGPISGPPPPQNPLQCVDAEWLVSLTAGAPTNTTVKVEWPNAQENASWNDATYVTLARYNGTDWREEKGGPTTFVDGAQSTASANHYSFSPVPTPFAVGSGLYPLPVGLTNFTVIPSVNNTVDLTWSTKSEKNNDRFIIERSIDAKNFNSIGEVKGNGNSNTEINYHFNDENPLAGNSYYRLNQLDIDGKSTLSIIKPVFIEKGKLTVRKIFPNPMGNNAFIDMYSPEDENIIYELKNFNGEVVRRQNLQLNKGDNLVEISLDDLGSGIFFINLPNAAQANRDLNKIIIGR